MGSYTSTLNDSGGNIWIKYGPREILGTILDFLTKSIPSIIGIGGANVVQAIEKAIKDAASQGNFNTIANGQSYKSEKLSLSLIHQANLVKTWSDSKAFYVQVGSIPEISGAKDGSINYYKISKDAQWGEVKQYPLDGHPSDSAAVSAATPGLVSTSGELHTDLKAIVSDAMKFAVSRHEKAVAASA